MSSALARASLFGVPGAFPFDHDGQALALQAKSVDDELGRRLERANAETAPSTKVEKILGRQLRVLTPFILDADLKRQVRQALAENGSLDEADAAVEIRRWVAQAAHVRPAMAAWRRLALYTQTMGHGRLALAVAQLPSSDGARWDGLPFDAEDGTSTRGGLSLLVHEPASSDDEAVEGAWRGLLIDQWSEAIPRGVEQTGVSFQYDAPGSQAPQAVLIAVPPQADAPSWDAAALGDILHQTIDLTRIRLVDSEGIDDLGQFLPGALLAENLQDHAASSPLRSADLLVDEDVIV
jgi:hypothetical protein